MGFSTPVLTAVSNWFIRKRGKALGIVLSGVGLGGLLIYPLGWVIDVYGWRTASFASGLAIWAICLPIVLLMRHKPEPYGYLPDGGIQGPTTTPLALETDFAASQAIRTRAFWFMSSAFALRVLVTGSVALHLRPFLLDIGFSGTTAYGALGSVALISVAGRFGLGWLGDRLNKRLVLSALFVIMSGSLWLLANTTQLWHVILFLATYAPTYGGMAVLMQSIRGDYFGRAAYGTIMGLMGMVLAVGTIFGPWFAGYVYDVTGSYRFAFSTFAVVSLFALFLMLGAKPPPAPNGGEPGKGQGLPVHSGNGH
jgi:MFS family permease